MKYPENLNQYHIKERPLNLSSTDVQYDRLYNPDKPNDPLIGIGIWIGSCILGYVILSKINNLKQVKYPHTYNNDDMWWSGDDGLIWWIYILPLIFSSWLTVVVMQKIQESRLPELARIEKERLEKQNRTSIRNNKAEAINASNQARRYITEGYDSLKVLFQSVKEIDHLIKNAEAEFKSNAFSPFWDKIEQSIDKFLVYNSQLFAIPSKQEYYQSVLKNREHNFPAYPIDERSLPNIQLRLKEFKRVVRLGQTNYQFASIYEHRKTRNVIIGGFKNLAEALNNIDSSVINAHKDFNDKLESLRDEVRNNNNF